MTHREYTFEIPYHLSGTYCSLIDRYLEEHPEVEKKLSRSLVKKITDGSGIFGSGVMVYKTDLDSLPDDVWESLKPYIS